MATLSILRVVSTNPAFLATKSVSHLRATIAANVPSLADSEHPSEASPVLALGSHCLTLLAQDLHGSVNIAVGFGERFCSPSGRRL